MEQEIFEAKRKLYGLLLSKEPDTLTNNEIDVMYYLSLDKQIQEHLSKNI